MSRILRLSTAPIAILDQPIAADKVVLGQPMAGLRPASEDEARGFYTGLWESEIGAWRIDYTEEELCVVVAGRVRLHDEEGQVDEFGPGDAFVIPRGFKGVWETVERMRKVYAIRT
jgi:uncharacterized cupin superfamily protein